MSGEFIYLKLGAAALSFYDMGLKLSLTKGKVIKATRGVLRSKRTSKALSAGHIVYATEAEFEAYRESVQVEKLGSSALSRPANDGHAKQQADKVNQDIQDNIDAFKAYMEEGLSLANITPKFTRGKLLDMALKMELDLDEDRGKENKASLAEKIFDELEAEEEDDDEDDDDKE